MLPGRFHNLNPLLFMLPFCALPAHISPAQTNTRSIIEIHIQDKGSKQPLPGRLTILDQNGKLTSVQAENSRSLAVRQGIIYTATGVARFNVPPGRYTVFATHGPEYSIAKQSIKAGERPAMLTLSLTREVDTGGYISSDTHIHTLTYSGHGDCSIEERMVTLAAENIELPIATEHNRHTDYSAAAQKTGTQRYFTPVIGNEVTTNVGHFNAFPIRADSPPPAFSLKDRGKILEGIRATPGVQCIILNHPNDLHAGFRPANSARFHPLSGESLDGQPWNFDGIEVINSSALQSDFMLPYRTWFALLNRSNKIVSIGASDSHDVDRYIVGQARTYIASSATQPDRINISEACANLKAGKALVSMGLLTEMWVDKRFGVGDLVTGSSKQMKVRIRVQGPRWVTADRVDLYANGQKIVSRPILHPSNAVTKADFTLTLPRPKQDVWLVAIASGPGITAPYWPLRRPYQPTRADWEPRVIGSTNPIRVDGDGDGRYTSPFAYAQAILNTNTADPTRLMQALEPYDEAVAVQAASLCREKGINMNAPTFQQAIENAAPAVRQGFVAYLALLASNKE